MAISLEITLIGFDKESEMCVYEVVVPATAACYAKAVAGVPPDDSDMIGQYQLSPDQAAKVAAAIPAPIDPHKCYYFLEADEV
jgi:hypothetical protein